MTLHVQTAAAPSGLAECTVPSARYRRLAMTGEEQPVRIVAQQLERVSEETGILQAAKFLQPGTSGSCMMLLRPEVPRVEPPVQVLYPLFRC